MQDLNDGFNNDGINDGTIQQTISRKKEAIKILIVMTDLAPKPSLYLVDVFYYSE